MSIKNVYRRLIMKGAVRNKIRRKNYPKFKQLLTHKA